MRKPGGYCDKHKRDISRGSAKCQQCSYEQRKSDAAMRRRKCEKCEKPLARGTQGARCQACFATAGRIISEEARVAPSIPPVPHLTGSAIVCSDLHAPWHHPGAVKEMCETAVLLGIKLLIIGGDVIHADTISKYLGIAQSVPITKELESLGRVLTAFESVFDRIVIIPGNHDQRVEKMIASLRDTKDGRRGLEMVAALLGAGDIDDAEDVALRYLRHFVRSPKVEWHGLPDLILNGAWLIQHPGSVSRIAPQNERKMIEKHRKSVIQGHSHLFGVGFDTSATDVAFNCGHLADDAKWRYMRERPTHFPKSVRGFGVIYQTKDCPEGRLMPIAFHDRWFRVADVAEMLKAAKA